jgi:hypothetical protein
MLFDKIFYIALFIATAIVLLLWGMSIAWASSTNGLKQIGKDEKWTKIYVYGFVFLGFVMMLVLGGNHQNDNFMESISLFAAILFALITWYLACVVGAGYLFEAKQMIAFYDEWAKGITLGIYIIGPIIKNPQFLELLKNQFPEDYEQRKEELEYARGFRGCQIFS